MKAGTESSYGRSNQHGLKRDIEKAKERLDYREVELSRS